MKALQKAVEIQTRMLYHKTGALSLGGVLGMAVSVFGLIYGYCIGERNLITMWLMLLAAFFVLFLLN